MRRPIALVLALLTTTLASVAESADLQVLSAGATKPAVSTLLESFRAATGHTVQITFDTMGGIAKRVAGGERADAVIGTTEGLAQLAQQGKIEAASVTPLGQTGIGVAVRESAPRPDISTPEAFKQTLMAARSIAYVDPTRGTSGRHFAGVLQQLGIAEAMQSKTRLIEGGYVAELVARGEAELAVHQISEILPVKGVVLVGPLPEQLQKITTYAAALTNETKSRAAAAAFIAHLSGGNGRAAFDARGLTLTARR